MVMFPNSKCGPTDVAGEFWTNIESIKTPPSKKSFTKTV
jgi:hypothetical protein